MKNSCIMVSFASSSASLCISIISEAECFFFLLLTWAGSSSSLLTSSIFEVLARAFVHGRWGGLRGQLRLRCPCFLQVKHLPAFMSSILSSALILLALAWPGVVCHEPRYWSATDRYRATLLQGKQAQDASLCFPYRLGPGRPWEIHAVTL